MRTTGVRTSAAGTGHSVFLHRRLDLNPLLLTDCCRRDLFLALLTSLEDLVCTQEHARAGNLNAADNLSRPLHSIIHLQKLGCVRT